MADTPNGSTNWHPHDQGIDVYSVVPHHGGGEHPVAPVNPHPTGGASNPPVKGSNGRWQTPQGERLSGGDVHAMGRSNIYEAERNGPAFGNEDASVHRYDYSEDPAPTHAKYSPLLGAENMAWGLASQHGDATDAARAVNDVRYNYAHGGGPQAGIAAGRVQDTDEAIAKSQGLGGMGMEYTDAGNGNVKPDYASMASIGKPTPQNIAPGAPATKRPR